MFLPKNYQLFEVDGSSLQHMPHVSHASIARPDRVRSVGKRNLPIRSKIRNHFNLRVKTVNVTRLMIHRVHREANAGKPERSLIAP
ncbi:hypothetical protein AciX9_0309 [Granulicella tundricola MP5ACTX9]|uniref:Uncharacterized protein n=2 Tax=Granulicella TaxID=940557 RepID=E8WWQ3_GRATM|nr:hypothetical protein AciX9_0309 [Granulicella tundricola MP5ACTX9]